VRHCTQSVSAPARKERRAPSDTVVGRARLGGDGAQRSESHIPYSGDVLAERPARLGPAAGRSCPPPRRRALPTEPGHGPAGAAIEHIQRTLPQSYVRREGVPRREGTPSAGTGRLCGKHHEQRVLPD
jgi:hypothetical protein